MKCEFYNLSFVSLIICVLFHQNTQAAFEYEQTSRNILNTSSPFYCLLATEYSECASSFLCKTHRLFGMKELTDQQYLFEHQQGQWMISLRHHRMGHPLYHEQTTALGLGKRIGALLALQGFIRFHHVSVPNVITQHAVTLDLALSCRIAPDCFCRIRTSNITRNHLPHDPSPLPQCFSSTLILKAFSSTDLLFECNKEPFWHPQFILGAIFKPVRYVQLKGGISLQPGYSTYEVGVSVKRSTLFYHIQLHPCLGATQGISIRFQFNEARN